MMWNRRPERGPNASAIPGPILYYRSTCGNGFGVWCVVDLEDCVAKIVRERAQQPRYRLIETAIGHHRRDRDSHAYVAVGAGDRIDAIGCRQWKLCEHIVSGRAAFAHQLSGADCGGHIL